MARKTANQGTGARAGGKTAGKTMGAKTVSGKMVRVTLVRSPIGFNRTQGETVIGLGLRRIRHTVELPDTPETRGMIHKVRHLVEVSD